MAVADPSSLPGIHRNRSVAGSNPARGTINARDPQYALAEGLRLDGCNQMDGCLVGDHGDG